MPKLMKALLATLVVVLFAVVAMIVWRSTSDSADSRPTVLAQKQVRSLFAHQPTIDWRVPVKDAAPEGLAAPEFGNGFSYDRSGPQVIDLIDTVIVGVVDSESAGELPSMVAIDVATGEIRWRAKGDPRTCASATIDGLLPCVIGTPSGGAGDEVAMIRVADGTIERTLPRPSSIVVGSIRGVRVLGDRVIVAGYGAGETGNPATIIVAGTVTDLSAHWTVSHSARSRCFGTGDSLYFEAGTDFISVGNDAGQTVVRSSDGSLITDERLANVQHRPGQGLIATSCRGSEPRSPRELLIYDTSGKLIRKHDSVTSGFAGVGVAGTAGGDAPYRVGTVVTAFDSGQPAWPSAGTVPDELAYGLTIEAIGDKALVSYPSCAQCVDATSNVMTGYTLDGGHNLWPQIHETLSSREWVTDGERIIWLDENKVAALDVATGRQAWAVPVGTGDPDYSGPGSLYRAGAGFVLRTKHYLTYFRPDA
ncbi:hypothetical protein GII30_17405 [Gordonia amarae]|uniref:PQQ-binding-like beta-propeller repeat protein n=1 Tax=Gordonia amarae TaxID=36821 RepID=A0A857MGM9_9ACTN|nr:hypothetical protein GII30_17405 [Gordonia amarae]